MNNKIMKKLICVLLVAAFALSGISVYAESSECNMGNFIADSYIYEAKKNGITDVDLALVMLDCEVDGQGLNDFSTEDLQACCKADSLVIVYVTGKTLKNLLESEVSLGSEAATLSFSGLRCKYNSCRMIFDRIIDIELYDEFGILGEREIENKGLYKLCCDFSTASYLESRGGLAKLLFPVKLRDADGVKLTSSEEAIMVDADGNTISDTVAVTDYLDFLEEIPDLYFKDQGRIRDIQASDIESRLEHPGFSTWVVIIFIIAVLWIGSKFGNELARRGAEEKSHHKTEL